MTCLMLPGSSWPAIGRQRRSSIELRASFSVIHVELGWGIGGELPVSRHVLVRERRVAWELCALWGELFDNEVPDELLSRKQIYR
ncbi:hypothetical protein [Paraburkholderia pallida]|uniref:Uncharacterized protein n=1 Tax=Paraburkholderia pallida TaxID=2547399 RepID=A0A4P7CZM1_9BURK|nr:hypothetical protein [Paraburkholderia pallida]QBQ99859.1 hypothetical protein E1956_22285 [Paraburkholderia pallida]